jgi:hypothetical protein
MIVHAGADPFIPPEDADRDGGVDEDARQRTRRAVERPGSRATCSGSAAVGPDEYRARVAAFLDALRDTSTIESNARPLEQFRRATAAPIRRRVPNHLPKPA